MYSNLGIKIIGAHAYEAKFVLRIAPAILFEPAGWLGHPDNSLFLL